MNYGALAADAITNIEIRNHQMEDIVRGYADRCPCHEEPFDPMNPEHEDRGPGTCAQCEAAAELLGR